MVAAARTGQRVTLQDNMSVVALFFLSFSAFQRCVDAVGVLQRWVVVAEELTVFEESKVLDAEDVGSLFFVLLDLDVFTQAHGKEKGKSWELGDGTLQWREILL